MAGEKEHTLKLFLGVGTGIASSLAGGHIGLPVHGWRSFSRRGYNGVLEWKEVVKGDFLVGRIKAGCRELGETTKRLRVMVIDKAPGRAAILERALEDIDHEVVAKLTGGADLYAEVERIQPDVIIVDLQSPDRDTLEQMREINLYQPRPVVMFADDGDSGTIEQAIRAGVSAYVVDGLSSKRVRPLLDVAIARFREYQALRNELDKAKSSLAERKVIERAKGLLMQHRGYSEEEAYQALRKMAMDKNRRIAEVAENLISAANMLM